MVGTQFGCLLGMALPLRSTAMRGAAALSLLSLALCSLTPPLSWVPDGDFQAYFASLAAAQPQYLGGAIPVGSSFSGAPLRAYCLGLSCAAQAQGDGGSAPGVLLTSLLHGREPLGALVNANLAGRLLERAAAGEASALALLYARRVVLWPNGNPDAYAFNLASPRSNMARKNRNPTCPGGGYSEAGVDLNRNFDFAWSVDNVGSSPAPCAEDFRGGAPFSEPESRALRDFVATGAAPGASRWARW